MTKTDREFAASPVPDTPAGGALEAATVLVPPTPVAPSAGGAGRLAIRAEHVVPGDVVVPRYGKPYEVEAVYLRQGGLVQIRSADGECKLFVLRETIVMVER